MNAKPRIVFCSLFKPVTDSRMYEKLAYSLSKTGKYEIIIIGHAVSELPDDHFGNIIFMPLFSFGRLSPKRVFAPFILFRKLLKLKPQLIINNSVDFLFIISIYKSIYRSKFIYDVQENYYLNIISNRYIPYLIRSLAAAIVRLTELISALYTDFYLLAEKTYKQELKFINPKKSVVLENKYANLYPAPVNRDSTVQNGRIILLYSGTIAEHYGIFDTIRFIEGFHEQYGEVLLHIIGFCPHKKTLNRLKNLIYGKEYISLTGGDKLVPHSMIIEAIQSANAGIINYHINPSTVNRFPTRIYEYLGNRLPVLIQDHKPWSDMVLKYKGGVITDFKAPDYETLYNQLINNTFYSDFIPEELQWESNEESLKSIISGII